MKENYFITGLENKLRTIRRKCKMHGRTKNNSLNNVLPVYFLPVWGNLASFHQNNLDFADQGTRRSQRLDSRSRHKINSGNWSLVVIQKFFLLKTNWSEKLLSRQVERTLPDGSLDMRHLIIILTKMRCCKWCYCDFCHLCIC